MTSPLAECICIQSTLQCRVSTVFSVCLDAVALPWLLLGLLSANCPALPRVIWPKYCSFSFATLLPINSLSRPNSVNIESFVRRSSHEMLSIFLQHHISKASILFLSDFFKVIHHVKGRGNCLGGGNVRGMSRGNARIPVLVMSLGVSFRGSFVRDSSRR